MLHLCYKNLGMHCAALYSEHYNGSAGTGKIDRDKLPCNDTYSLAGFAPSYSHSYQHWISPFANINPNTQSLSFHIS
jgi:hypothetical protein